MNEEVTEHAEELEDLLAFLRDARGFDFSGYKRSSLTRRIQKRMQDVGVEDFADYRDLLEANSAEFGALFTTILINVTGFFRDNSAWEYLQRDVLPHILEQSGDDEELRLWCAGCSSGEEAYSLAIAFAELMGVEQFAERVKIYGTDVDEEALHHARTGVYSAKALEPMPEGLLDKYFERSGVNHVFRPDLRRRVIFGRHDITRDAPISRLHFLSCRNTLMYFNVETQTQIIDRFHFALREGGYLFLGKAEMLLSDGERFDVANMRQRMFRRRPGESGPPYQPSIRFERLDGAGVAVDARRRQLRELAVDVDPNGIIVLDNDGIVALINGEARATFTLSDSDLGRPFRDLELSYRPAELRSVIERVQAELRALRINSVELNRMHADVQYFDIMIQPLFGPDRALRGTALVFIDTTRTTQMQRDLKRSREDLETAYEELQSTNEELETTNEELQSSIEELETTNEELQSTNEELETTNEELQSGNEELETMNDEMRNRSAELDEARTFVEGVLTSVAAAVIVLDANLKVRAWNRGAQEIWGLRIDEVDGEPFFDLEFGLPTRLLYESAVRSVKTGARSEEPLEVQAVNRLGAGIRCTIMFSPLNGNRDEGVVMLIEQESDNAR
ncbi:MAG TPA: CheR family methyltransferase [Jatrophihabitans sp.]